MNDTHRHKWVVGQWRRRIDDLITFQIMCAYRECNERLARDEVERRLNAVAELEAENKRLRASLKIYATYFPDGKPINAAAADLEGGDDAK